MITMMNGYAEKTCMTSKQEANTTGETETFVFLLYRFQNYCQLAIINLYVDLKMFDNVLYSTFIWISKVCSYQSKNQTIEHNFHEYLRKRKRVNWNECANYELKSCQCLCADLHIQSHEPDCPLPSPPTPFYILSASFLFKEEARKKVSPKWKNQPLSFCLGRQIDNICQGRHPPN